MRHEPTIFSNLSTNGFLKTSGGTGTLIVDTAVYGTGDVLNGGNSTGASLAIGTNDNFAVNLETAGVTRLSVTGTSPTLGGQFTFTNLNANTNTIQDVVVLQANTSGTAAAGFGARQVFQLESSTTDNQDAGAVGALWTTATHLSRTSAVQFSGVNNAGALGEFARFEGATVPVLKIASAMGTPGTTTYRDNGITTNTSYVLGNSGNSLTLGGSSGTVILSTTSSTAASNIVIAPTGNSSAGVASITIGNAATFTQTSGTRNYMNFDYSFSPTSGTAIHNQFSFTGTFNQTGGANGIVRAINIAHTVTAVADYRAIEIADNGTNVKGVYQTGSNATNNLVGKTTFGSTATPTALVALAAGTTTVPPLQQTSGTINTTALAGSLEYNGSHYATKGSTLRFATGGVIADHFADVANVGTGETDIYIYTTPASTLAVEGEKVEFKYTLNLSDMTATAQIQVYFAGTVIGNTGALTVSSIGAVIVTGWIIRTGAATARASVNISSPTASTAIYTAQTDLIGLTLSNTNILKVTATSGGAGGGSGDITGKSGTVSWWGAAAN